MFAQQTALNVVSHNVANANTEGYSVQRANLQTTKPFGMPSLTTAAEPGQVGTGVEVASITRTRDEFLDYYVRKETSTLKRFESREYFYQK
ncbi:flagellar basal body protein [Caloramator sp. Dgby_cultured_2]|uniref:flagellar basal body protein n=1 Tax=Caloramator sp. Dgby_cultured_2 TaxID=3029174 RepID=UPI00237D3682|nr:flagellar basal body protein [Caloramator sp. Dgby_cultured_2]WDU83943.1 flagellar basal body protein [Caloramator sp. Dgby_cultured_2]